jgi:hypothetical protein
VSLVDLLLEAPDDQLDSGLKPYIEGWSNPPKALEILEVLDKAIYGGLASAFVISVLQSLYDGAVRDEGTTHEAVVKLATWRDLLSPG